MKTLKGVLERLNGKCIVPQLMTDVVPLSKALNNYKLQVSCNIDEFMFRHTGCVQKQKQMSGQSKAASESLVSWLSASVLWRYLTKLILNRLLRQRNGLTIYNKSERALMITKWTIINYYNTNFLLEITSKVEKFGQKHTFAHKLSTNHNFQMPYLFLAQLSQNGKQRIMGDL